MSADAYLHAILNREAAETGLTHQSAVCRPRFKMSSALTEIVILVQCGFRGADAQKQY